MFLQVELKPASDVLAGAVARAASQGTIHPLDTLKVRLQTHGRRMPRFGFSKFSKLVPPPGSHSFLVSCSASSCTILGEQV
jgi:Mitochondrial carrier protein